MKRAAAYQGIVPSKGIHFTQPGRLEAAWCSDSPSAPIFRPSGYQNFRTTQSSEDGRINKKKRVWVVGHSLGAAHAQLYAAYLTANGLSPQGVYAITAPHVGDQPFVNQLNGMFPNNRLQRFDFVHDPVTKVPPNAPLPQPD